MRKLLLWWDETLRGGPENMAVDEWLLKSAREPVLRIYGWRGAWGSCGYFVPAAETAAALGGSPWVRRWTGGGIVDHRSDWTYTLVIPHNEPLAGARGGESYRVIHRALAAALAGSGARLAGELPPARGGRCFEKAVEHDIVDREGRKIAGAGQRRTLQGLLHQGSLAWRPDRAQVEFFAANLAAGVETRMLVPDSAMVAGIIAVRYGLPAWNERR